MELKNRFIVEKQRKSENKFKQWLDENKIKQWLDENKIAQINYE